MKKVTLIGVLTLSLCLCAPTLAQTRKEKKAAKKAQWEMQQQQAKEEAELLHQIKMDSIKAVQEEKDIARAEAKAALEEQKRREKEEYEAAKAKAKYNSYVQPCIDYDTKEYYVAFGTKRMKHHMQSQYVLPLLGSLRVQVKGKINGSYKAVVTDYLDQMDVEENSSFALHIERAGIELINSYVNDSQVYCQEITVPDESGYVTMYMLIRVYKNDLVDEILNNIPEDVKNDVRMNEVKFRELLNNIFNERGE